MRSSGPRHRRAEHTGKARADATGKQPLAHFLVPANYQRRRYEMEGLVRKYVAVPYEGRYIWGATAGMLYFFFQLLRG